jgi:hypothetical protein
LINEYPKIENVSNRLLLPRRKRRFPMRSFRLMLQLGLLIGFMIEISPTKTTAQTTTRKNAEVPAEGFRKLTGDDVKRAEDLTKSIDAALMADRWDEAIAKAKDLLALRARAQGPKHFDTVSAEWTLKALSRVAPMPDKDRAAYQSARIMEEQGEKLNAQAKYALAQPLVEKALEIRRRLLTDDHPLIARVSTRRPNPCTRKRSIFAADYSPTITRTPRSVTITWRTTDTPRGNTSKHATSGWQRPKAWMQPDYESHSLAWSAPGPRSSFVQSWPPCWPGSVSRHRRGKR